MFSLLKKFISALLVLWVVAVILNLKVGGRPAREWTERVWKSEVVQKVYTEVRDRILALVRKDISVEDVFKSELPKKDFGHPAQENSPSPGVEKQEIKTINLEQLDEKDRQALDRILDKAGH